jgi:hypothetical protein
MVGITYYISHIIYITSILNLQCNKVAMYILGMLQTTISIKQLLNSTRGMALDP